MPKTPTDPERNRERARKLGLWGLLAHWDEVQDEAHRKIEPRFSRSPLYQPTV